MNALLIASALAVSGVSQNEGPKLTIGKEAPAFTLTSVVGKEHSLEDFRGKFVVLEWTNHQCPFVVKHYKNGDMQASQKWAADKGVIWLSIVSSAEGKQGFVTAEEGNDLFKEQKVAAAAKLLDPKGVVGREYGARTTPHMYVIDPKGNLIYQGAIDSVRSANPDDIKGATNYVRQALTEAMAGKAVSTPITAPYGCSVKY